MQLLQRNKPTIIKCVHDPDYEMSWDSDELVFFVEFSEKWEEYLDLMGYHRHPLVPEILVYSDSFDYKCVYIARPEDFDELEMF